MSKSPLTFRIFQGGKLVREETLALGVIKLGKVASAHLRIDDETVSRMHAIIEVNEAGAISLIDLGSTRGTFVNGTKINKATIADGDVITVGDTRIELSVAPAVATAPVAPAPTPLPPPTPIRATATPVPMPMPLPMPAPSAAPLALLRTDAGAGAVEVAAMLGDSVVEVKHCMDPRSGKVTRATYAMLGASLVCIATAAVAFAANVQLASRNAAALDYWTHVSHKQAYAFRPETPMSGEGALEIIALAAGLGLAGAGLARSRRERKSPYFRIGTAPGVELATESAPSASFPLVAPSGDDFVFNFAAGMDGEMVVGGKSTPLHELVASGQARPSAIVAGALELPIPAAARIRARAGATTFLVSAVDRPQAQPLASFVLDSRAAMYAAASLLAHIGLYGLAQLGTADAASIGVSTNTGEDLTIRASTTSPDDPPPPPPDPSSNDGGNTGGGGKMALEEGAAGNPNAPSVSGHMEVKNNNRETPALARLDAIEYAKTAGVLGDTRSLDNAIKSLAGTEDFSNGLDAESVYGPLFGAAGEGKGNFGTGRSGWGAGGGCTADDCRGIGAGAYHTIGTGPGTGGWGPGGTGGPGLPGRHPLVPTVHIDMPIADGDLDKAIIRRYVNRQRDKIAYCYNREVLAHPSIQGDVNVQFFIGTDGSVQSAKGAGFNGEVSSCVADIVHSISFPAPRGGSGVLVNYPFHFHMAAGQ